MQVKDNQLDTKQQIVKLFEKNQTQSSSTENDFGHGRIEQRTDEIIDDLNFLMVSRNGRT